MALPKIEILTTGGTIAGKGESETGSSYHAGEVPGDELVRSVPGLSRVADITVREISEKADINRGTFYLHYRDIFDLMEQIENELLEELEDVLNHFKASDLLSNPALVFTRVFQLVKENSDMVSILIGQNGDINFVNRLKDIVREKCLKDWMEVFRSGNAAAFDAFFSFIVSGCIGLVQYWLQTGLKETPEQMAKLTEHIITKGIGVLEIDPYV